MAARHDIALYVSESAIYWHECIKIFMTFGCLLREFLSETEVAVRPLNKREIKELDNESVFLYRPESEISATVKLFDQDHVECFIAFMYCTAVFTSA